LFSDWNHGNAHFLRGIAAELIARENDVQVFEPVDGWSRANLIRDHGHEALDDIERAFPVLHSETYDTNAPDIPAMTAGADLVLVHEWSSPELVAALGRYRRDAGYHLLFHDTHHRAVTQPDQMSRYDLSEYDGVLAFGQVLQHLYTERGWARRAWTWHEAADTTVFYPRAVEHSDGQLVWIGNWGDDERTRELHEYLMEPVQRLALRAHVYGVRYPPPVQQALAESGITYRGWLPNHCAPSVFAAHSMTVHIPRAPYAHALPGIPTIRPFEALACGIPLVSAPWDDCEELFTPGADYLVARSGREMDEHLRLVLSDPDVADSLREHGLRTVTARHTCRHRVDELLEIAHDIGVRSAGTEKK